MNLRDQNPRTESKRPWGSREEMLVEVALQNARSDEATIRATRPVNVPQNIHPERFGFQSQVPGINDILNVDRYTPSNRSWMSGMPVRHSIMSDQSWSGTARNSMSEGTF